MARNESTEGETPAVTETPAATKPADVETPDMFDEGTANTLGVRLVPPSAVTIVTDPADPLCGPLTRATRPVDMTMVASLQQVGQLQEVVVFKEAGALKVVIGRGRARAGQHLEAAGDKFLLRIREVAEKSGALALMRAAENAVREDLTINERVEELNLLQKEKLSDKEIAIGLKCDVQVVRQLKKAAKVLDAAAPEVKALATEGKVVLRDLLEADKLKGQEAKDALIVQKASRRVLVEEEVGEAAPGEAPKTGGKKKLVTPRPAKRGAVPMSAIKGAVRQLQAELKDGIKDAKLRARVDAVVLAYAGELSPQDVAAALGLVANQSKRAQKDAKKGGKKKPAAK